MLRNSFFPVLLFCLLWQESGAQINESDTIRFQLRGTLNGNFQQGNVEILTLRGRLDLLFAPGPDWVFKTQNSSLYQAFYSKKADNDIFSRNYLYFRPQRKVYPFAIAYVSANFRRKIESRYFAGAGATWQAVNRWAAVLKFSASTVYESTRFESSVFNDPEYDGSETIRLWRGTLYAGGWAYLWQRRARFVYDVFWQPAFAHAQNYRSQFDLGVDFPVWKGLFFNVLYTYTHENVVVEKVLRDDRILTFGVGYSVRKK